MAVRLQGPLATHKEGPLLRPPGPLQAPKAPTQLPPQPPPQSWEEETGAWRSAPPELRSARSRPAQAAPPRRRSSDRPPDQLDRLDRKGLFEAALGLNMQRAHAPMEHVLQSPMPTSRPPLLSLQNPALTPATDGHYLDGHTDALNMSAMGDLCWSMEGTMRRQRQESEQIAAALQSELSQLRVKQQLASHRAASEASRALKLETANEQLRRALDASTEREKAQLEQEQELRRQLRGAEQMAALVPGLNIRLDEAKELRVAEAANNAARRTAADAEQHAGLSNLSAALNAAQLEAGHWREAAARAATRGRGAITQVGAARAAVEQMLAKLATAKSLEELGAMNQELMAVKAKLHQTEEELALLEADRPPESKTKRGGRTPRGGPPSPRRR